MALLRCALKEGLRRRRAILHPRPRNIKNVLCSLMLATRTPRQDLGCCSCLRLKTTQTPDIFMGRICTEPCARTCRNPPGTPHKTDRRAPPTPQPRPYPSDPSEGGREIRGDDKSAKGAGPWPVGLGDLRLGPPSPLTSLSHRIPALRSLISYCSVK